MTTLTEVQSSPEKDALIAAVIRLQNLIPILSPHQPEGWVDFRNAELNREWRGGVFYRVDEMNPPFHCKWAFGSLGAARLAAHLLYVVVGTGAEVQKNSECIWTVLLAINPADVCW